MIDANWCRFIMMHTADIIGLAFPKRTLALAI